MDISAADETRKLANEIRKRAPRASDSGLMVDSLDMIVLLFPIEAGEIAIGFRPDNFDDHTVNLPWGFR